MIETNRRSIEDATGLRVQHSPVCCVPVSGAERNLPDRSLSLLSSWHYRGQPTTNRQSPDGPGGLIVLMSGGIIPPYRPKNYSPGLTVCLWKNFPSLLLIYLPIRLLSRLPFVSLSLLQVIMCKVLTGAGGRGRWRANASVIPPLLRRNVSLGSPMGREVQSCWSLFICWEAHPSIKLETIWLLNDTGTRLKKFDNSSIVRRLPSLSSIRNTFDWSR